MTVDLDLTLDLFEQINLLAKEYADELVAVRRDLHAHPELARAEVRTTGIVCDRLAKAGLAPRVLPGGSGVVCDVGEPVPGGAPLVALRADLDALPVPDEKDVSYRSVKPGVSHACGHDVHTAIVLGAALVLAELEREGALRGRVRLVFQPAEEAADGALDVIEAGGLDGVGQIFALHCDPRLDVGLVGLRSGPITSAIDKLRIRLTGHGGHTARPHLTGDLVFALAKLVTELPATLSRRVDPRSGFSLVWGRINAGAASNVIPKSGEVEGTVRCLDASAWHRAPVLIEQLTQALATAFDVEASVDYRRGAPPVVNDPGCIALLDHAAQAAIGEESVTWTEQSLGGEDFSWYLEHVPGALARLGVRTPGDTGVRDLHQGSFDADEGAILLGVRLLVSTALLALR